MIQKIKELLHEGRQNWVFWLLIITIVAIILRSVPAWTHAAWGCDFGIYYGLANSFVENKELFSAYTGWGSSYQFFPVLYVITGVSHWITGLDVITLMPKIAPIFGGLSVLLFYFVVYELIGDRKKALLASAFLAVLPFHVYQTSHAAPLTIGHFFMVLSLYFFIKFRKDKRYVVPLLCSTVLLTMSHHLTTYFYLISLIFIVFIENAGSIEWVKTVKADVAYILLTSGIVFSYWIVVAKPVFESFMMGGLRLGPLEIDSIVVIVLFYVFFFSLFGVIWMKRKLHLFLEVKEPTRMSCLWKFSVSMFVCVAAMSVFSVVTLPWTNFRFTLSSILFAVPLLMMISFGVAGFRFTRFVQNGGFIRGWMLALLVSFVYSLVSRNGTLPPDRHLEYIMVPLSIIAVFGLQGIFFNLRSEVISKWKTTVRRIRPTTIFPVRTSRIIQKRQVVYFVVIVILVTTNAVSVYPSFVSLNAAYEVISDDNMAVLEWMDVYVDKNVSVVASDHRLARMAEAVGFRTTLDEASVLWVATNLSEYLPELVGSGKNYSRITHVLIDEVMKEQVVHVHFGEMQYMTNASYEKFLAPLFELVYRNASVSDDGVETGWTELYAVNWSYLEQHEEFLVEVEQE
ncbi:MAG: hypothetical protein V1726_02110 [Methanobacteriota archaeon]